LRPGTVGGSIILGIIGFLMFVTIILIPLGAVFMLLAFIFFIYGLATSPPPPVQYVRAPPPPPAPHTPSVITICPQCRSPIAADANYCPKCGADTRARAKEIVKEKEVIVKIRCSYCHNLYDETLDKCPHCGATRS
jgi:hypothetical protein